MIRICPIRIQCLMSDTLLVIVLEEEFILASFSSRLFLKPTTHNSVSVHLCTKFRKSLANMTIVDNQSLRPESSPDGSTEDVTAPCSFSYCCLVIISMLAIVHFFMYLLPRYSKVLWLYHFTLNSKNKNKNEQKKKKNDVLNVSALGHTAKTTELIIYLKDHEVKCYYLINKNKFLLQAVI